MIKIKVNTVKQNEELVGFEVDYKNNKKTTSLEHLVAIDYLIKEILSHKDSGIKDFDDIIEHIKLTYERGCK